MSTTTIIHAPHFESGKSLCGITGYNLELSHVVTCPACLELQIEAATVMAEFEDFSEGYYAQVGALIQAELCRDNAYAYRQRAAQIQEQTQQAA